MGYRLDVNYIDEELKVQNLYYGTKLYGYDLPLSESLSYEFLCVINKMNGEEIFDYGCCNQFELNYNELIMFLKLYAIDYKNYGFSKENNFLEEKEIKDLFQNVGKYEEYIYIIQWI